jgi:predicted enzyme related to lactoylglutathione lyase
VGEVSAYPEGTFCWVDLATTDLSVAKRFYERLHGWQFDDMSPTYSLCRLNGRAVTGVFGQPDLGEVAPQWNNYIAVTDADAMAQRAADLGATIVEQPFDVNGDGRTAVIRDPSGAAVCLWQPRNHAGAQLVNEPGSLTWNDLVTRDLDAAKAFYTALFGWTADDVGGGEYTTLTRGKLLIGGMQRIRTERPELRPHWLPYFVVRNADEAAAIVTDGAGEIVVPPREVPAGRFAIIRDPAGAASAIFEMGPEGASRGVDSL